MLPDNLLPPLQQHNALKGLYTSSRLHPIKSQKAAIFIVTAMRTTLHINLLKPSGCSTYDHV